MIMIYCNIQIIHQCLLLKSGICQIIKVSLVVTEKKDLKSTNQKKKRETALKVIEEWKRWASLFLYLHKISTQKNSQVSQYFSTVSSSLFHNESKSKKTRSKNKGFGSEICVTNTKTHVQNDQMNHSPPLLRDHSTHITIWSKQKISWNIVSMVMQ